MRVTDLIVPSTSTVGVGTLVARVDVDENTAFPVVISGALAVSATAVAGEGDSLTGESAASERAGEKVDVRRSAGIVHASGGESLGEEGEGSDKGEGNEASGEHLAQELVVG